MKTIQRIFAAIALSLAIFFTSPSLVVGGTDPKDSNLATELGPIAERVLSGLSRALVTGDVHVVNKGSVGHAVAPLYQPALQDRFTKIFDEREMLADHGITYTEAITQLTVESLQVKGNEAVMLATEYTVLKLNTAGDPLAPETTEYGQEHRFTFVHDEYGQWKLSGDELLNTLGSAVTEELEGADPGIPDEDIKDQRQLSRSSLGGYLEAAPTFNRQAIVDYAYRYWGPSDRDYNSAYRSFAGAQDGGDCTNFVSQALRAGGWSEVSGWYRSDDVWWYTRFTQSWTWAGAQNWSRFIARRPRGGRTENLTLLNVGDILQIDFNRDGRMDHTMIVTQKDSRGTLYMTYHSTNTKDRLLVSIRAQNPNARYYGWRLTTPW